MRVAFRLIGSGGRTFVLVHGLGVSGSYFARLARALSPGGRVLVPDLPGTGRSEHPPKPLTIQAQADVLEALLARVVPGEGAVLVGNSLGCQVVLDLAWRRPPLADALVLIGPSVDPRFRSPLRQFATMAVDLVREPPALWALVARDYLVAGPRGVLAAATSALEDRPEEKLPGITSPVLVIRGEHDALTTRAWAQRCAELAPLGAFAAVPGAAHAPHFSHPHVVAALVERFLAERDDRGP